MKPLLSVFTAFLICIACTSEERPVHASTLDNFKSYLKADMTHSQIVKTFGEPAKDIGSGIHIYVYGLPDSTEVWIGFSDKIMYAKHVDEQGKVLFDIL